MKPLWIILLGVGCLPQQTLDPSQACAERAIRFSSTPLPVETMSVLFETCHAGDLRSCSALGVMYETGRLTSTNKVYAGYLFNWACSRGNQLGCSNFRRLTGSN